LRPAGGSWRGRSSSGAGLRQLRKADERSRYCACRARKRRRESGASPTPVRISFNLPFRESTTHCCAASSFLAASPLRVDAVEKVGRESRRRNNRIEKACNSNQRCAGDWAFESKLRGDALKIFFQQYRPEPDLGDPSPATRRCYMRFSSQQRMRSSRTCGAVVTNPEDRPRKSPFSVLLTQGNEL
jgi:hypothetical protein